ncbi:MAG: right-handed parallel beta-helix repeat-containing protein [Phycisphaerales bacterium]|nr:MAG: right-handed parallel beta-helix repeat-containing protein [Phycisphaerales bacterium]
MIGRRNIKMWLAICSLMVVLVSAAAGTTHYVNPGESIQAAIDAANPGDEIEVAPGTYYEAIDFKGKAVRLYSKDGAAVTIIDGSGFLHVVQCIAGEGADTVLEGFTITGAYASQVAGGGMYNDPGSPTVTKCTFTLNYATVGGGGMYNGPGSNPTVIDCTFSGNSTWMHGGGMSNRQSSPTVTNCVFTGNHAGAYYGGGMYNYNSSPTVTNCTFANNTADFGGGMSNYPYSSPTLTNCTFRDNSALGAGGMHNHLGCSPQLTDCMFTGNSASGDSGGMSNHSGSNAVLINCSFTGNSAGGTGGGMQNAGSHVTLTDCTFSGNTAVENGGGMQDRAGSNSTVTNCVFTANWAGGEGGGMRNDQSSPTVVNCCFTSNTGAYGGGMSNQWGSPNVTNCTFSDNLAVWNGGGMYNQSYSSPTVTNCTFSDNRAPDYGGGMYNTNNSSPAVTNCIFSSNICCGGGGGIGSENSSPTATNCIFWGDTPNEIYNEGTASPTITYCDVQGGWTGTGNIDLDPMFADADGRLSLGSPCIDVGDNTAVPADITTDLDGNPRIVNGTVDMGAYEYPITLVLIDIKPGSYPNAININGNGVIPVAILGSAEFDVAQVVIGSLDFAGLEVRVKPNGVSQCSISDVSGPEGVPDGYDDLVCQFLDDPLLWMPGDGIADLTGMFSIDGKVVPFAGSDEIKIVP